MFISSYAPLFLILAIRFDKLPLRLGCLGLCLLGVVDALVLTRRARSATLSYEITPQSIEDLGAEVGGYLASYLLPFVTVSVPSGADLAAYGTYLIVAAVVYVRSDLVRVNPTLYLLGYRVLAITIGADKRREYLVTRHDRRPGERLQVVDVAGIALDTGRGDATT
jgi:hypothetical protein